MSARVETLEVEEAKEGLLVSFNKSLGLCEDNITAIAAELFQVAERLGRRTLSIDLGRVRFLGSTALGQFISLHKQVRAGGGRLTLRNASPSVYEVFEVTRVSTFLEITPPIRPPPGRPLRVLIADDCDDAAASLRNSVLLWGYETRVARDGAAVLEAADTFQPHVVLFDIQMPWMSGDEVAARRRRRPEGERGTLDPTTANESDDSCLAPYNGLFNHDFCKPYDLDRLERFLAACAAEIIPEGPNSRPGM